MDLIKPTREELSYTKELHHNPNTMRYQHHIDEITNAQLDALYQKIDQEDLSQFLYRYVYCHPCEFMVGEAGWQKEDDRYYMFLTIAYDFRREGYGTSALNDLLTLAKENNISTLYVRVLKDNPFIPFLTKKNFVLAEENPQHFIYSISTF